jgi:hypothetical protein
MKLLYLQGFPAKFTRSGVGKWDDNDFTDDYIVSMKCRYGEAQADGQSEESKISAILAQATSMVERLESLSISDYPIVFASTTGKTKWVNSTTIETVRSTETYTKTPSIQPVTRTITEKISPSMVVVTTQPSSVILVTIRSTILITSTKIVTSTQDHRGSTEVHTIFSFVPSVAPVF